MLEDVLLFDQPFRHFLCFDTFRDDDAAEMRDVLSSDLDWGIREGSFYVTYRLDLRAFFENRRPPRFLGGNFLFEMRQRMAEVFSAPLSDHIQVLGHRMIPGQQIGVHNDNPGLGFENYRIVTQFTVDQRPEDGGELNIHTSDRPQDIYQSIRPCPNMSFGFEASSRSYHSVNLVQNRNRDAVLFNFWHMGNAPAVETAIRSATAGLRHRGGVNGAAAAAPESGMEAALLAEGLISRWGLDPHVGAAAALLALQSAPPRGDTVAAARAALASRWRAKLGLGDGANGEPDPSGLVGIAARWMCAAPAEIEAALSVAVWVAWAPRRMFRADSWEAVRSRVMPYRDRLPEAARPLADDVFENAGRVCAGS